MNRLFVFLNNLYSWIISDFLKMTIFQSSFLIIFSTWHHSKCYASSNTVKSISPKECKQIGRKAFICARENKLLTNCCLSYFRLAGRGGRWVMQESPCRCCCSLKFSSNVCSNFKLARPRPFALSKSILVSLFSHFDPSRSWYVHIFPGSSFGE